MSDHDAHYIIVMLSHRSRDAYAAEATARGETYTFTDAWGLPRTWVKGEYAYLAPNAADLLLGRCNLKHHLVEEAALDAAQLARCRALLVPNAGHLAPETIARIETWLSDGDRRLIVTGKTNLPPRLLGLQSCDPAPVQGYTGWRWRTGSPFAGDAWEPLYVSGYKGHPAHRIVPASMISLPTCTRPDSTFVTRLPVHTATPSRSRADRAKAESSCWSPRRTG